MCVCEFIKIRIISPQGLILSTFEATLINETYSIYNETHTHTHYYHLHSRCFFDNVRSNPFKMYKYSRQERLRISSSPNRNANLHHVNRTTFYQISPIPTYLNTRWYFAYRTPLHAPCTTVTRKQVSTCHIAIRNRPVAYNLYAAVVAPLLLLFTTLLRHVGSSQRVVLLLLLLLQQKIIFVPCRGERWHAVREKGRKEKKNRRKGGGGIQPSIFRVDAISRGRARKWTSHATPCVLMDVDLKIRSFSCSCRDERFCRRPIERESGGYIKFRIFISNKPILWKSSLLGPRSFVISLKSSFIFVCK